MEISSLPSLRSHRGIDVFSPASTSALTFIEVVKLEKGQPKLPKESEEKISDFFRHEWIYIIN